jgi:hypothetical protein
MANFGTNIETSAADSRGRSTNFARTSLDSQIRAGNPHCQGRAALYTASAGMFTIAVWPFGARVRPKIGVSASQVSKQSSGKKGSASTTMRMLQYPN